MNGTTNFMLSKMESEGADYGEVLKEAQDLGYAEGEEEVWHIPSRVCVCDSLFVRECTRAGVSLLDTCAAFFADDAKQLESISGTGQGRYELRLFAGLVSVQFVFHTALRNQPIPALRPVRL